MKIRPVGVDLFHADGRKDATKLIVAFRSFAKKPRISQPLLFLGTIFIAIFTGVVHVSA
jgi:hypothetical protein